jgi:chorismate lyase/3-hydroxybenzoate synthase
LRRASDGFTLQHGSQILNMSTSVTSSSPAIVRRSADPLEAPPLAAWVENLFGDVEASCSGGAMTRRRDGLILVSTRVRDAIRLSVDGFENATLGAYESIARELAATRLHAVRFWNHVPQINEILLDGRDRYMAFNAGRYRAYCNWYGGPGAFEQQIATATGIGHRGNDLFVYCLGTEQPGVAVENPRQVAPYHYSKRFGPLPPAFARATVLHAAEQLPGRILIGGTASVRGEDSVHFDDLAQQLEETFVNLAALVSAASTGSNGSGAGHRSSLARYRELRAYIPDESSFEQVIAAIAVAFPKLQRLELLRADLCRSELLIEIEGIAS